MTARLAKSGRSPPLANARNDLGPSLTKDAAGPPVRAKPLSRRASLHPPVSFPPFLGGKHGVPECHARPRGAGGSCAPGKLILTHLTPGPGGARRRRRGILHPGPARAACVGRASPYGCRFLETSWSRFLTHRHTHTHAHAHHAHHAHAHTHHAQVRERPLLQSWSLQNRRGRGLSASRATRARGRGQHPRGRAGLGWWGLEKAPTHHSPPPRAPARDSRRTP